MSLKNLKSEMRLFLGTDLWGEAVDTFMECAGRMSLRGLSVPPEWEYKPGNSPCETGAWLHDFFEMATDEELNKYGAFLFRYCRILKHFQKDY